MDKEIDELNLLQEDQQIVLSQTAWINDRIIDAYQRLLQQGAGKDFGGFQSVCPGQTMYFLLNGRNLFRVCIQGIVTG